MAVDDQPVVIAVDPHKTSWTAAVVSAGTLQPVAGLRVGVSREGYRELRRFARRWPGARWAIEGATGLGAPLLFRMAERSGATIGEPPDDEDDEYGVEYEAGRLMADEGTLDPDGGPADRRRRHGDRRAGQARRASTDLVHRTWP